MGEDAGDSKRGRIVLGTRRLRHWLMRPRTVRIVAPATFLLGLVLVGIGLWALPSGGGRTGEESAVGPGPSGIGGPAATVFPVPPDLIEARSYLVPSEQIPAGFRLAIESIGVDTLVVQLGLDPRNVPQVPNDGGKVAWYDFTAKPGTGGNAVFSGHVRWAGDPGSFARLDELEEGDVILLKWNDGRRSTYEVFDNIVVDASRPEALQVMAPRTQDIITLITCAGTFVADPEDPLGGDFTDRVVVQARLVEEPSVAAVSP